MLSMPPKTSSHASSSHASSSHASSPHASSPVAFYRTQLSLANHHLHSSLDSLCNIRATLLNLAATLDSDVVRRAAAEVDAEIQGLRKAIEVGGGRGVTLCGACGREVEDVVVDEGGKRTPDVEGGGGEEKEEKEGREERGEEKVLWRVEKLRFVEEDDVGGKDGDGDKDEQDTDDEGDTLVPSNPNDTTAIME